MEIIRHIKTFVTKSIFSLFLSLAIFVSILLVLELFNIKTIESNFDPKPHERRSDLLFSRDLTNHCPEILFNPTNVNCSNGLLLIMLVTSYVGNAELRNVHRKVMPDDLLKQHNVQRIFLLAKIPLSENNTKQSEIDKEIKDFGDILQGDFYEHYRNLTVKHLMGLNWAATHCRKSKFIMKLDDDIVFNFERSIAYLNQLGPNDTLLGNLIRRNLVKRTVGSKWYVTYDEYYGRVYPNYLSGWLYITTPYIASMLVKQSKYHKYFFVDDVFITGILSRSLNIHPQHFDYLFLPGELFKIYIPIMFDMGIPFDDLVGDNNGDINMLVEYNEMVKLCKIRNCTSDRFKKFHGALLRYRGKNISLY